MVRNLIMDHSGNFANLMACFFASLVLIPHHKMEKPREEFEESTTLFALYTYTCLPSSFWHHALQMATYLLNILPVFGCQWYPLFLSTTINKLQACSIPCVFLRLSI